MKITKYLLVIVVMALLITACTVPEVVTHPDGTVVTNQVVDPRIIGAIETGKAINVVTTPVNPYAGLVTILLGFATVVTTTWGSVATWLKNKKAQQLKVVVQGVEQAGAAADPVKLAIANHSANAGIKLELDSVVQDIVSGQT